MRIKIFIVISFLIYQTCANSKASEINEFNQKYLSNYLSALLSSDNQNNNEAIKFFNSSKFLIQKHDNFLKEFIFSLVIDGQVKKAINLIKFSKDFDNSNFFEANLLMFLDSINKNNYKKAFKKLKKLENFKEKGTYEFIIYETLKSYNNLFLNKTIEQRNDNFGKLSIITNAFQNCYLNTNKTNSHFLNLINSEEGDYSRYLFFYLANIIENNEYDTAKKISSTIEPLKSSLLITQSKKWIDDDKFNKFDKFFSCKNTSDLLSEFFFLLSNLYSSEDNFEKSNFYLSMTWR